MRGGFLLSSIFTIWRNLSSLLAHFWFIVFCYTKFPLNMNKKQLKPSTILRDFMCVSLSSIIVMGNRIVSMAGEWKWSWLWFHFDHLTLFGTDHLHGRTGRLKYWLCILTHYTDNHLEREYNDLEKNQWIIEFVKL